jgi:hypothetical protein
MLLGTAVIWPTRYVRHYRLQRSAPLPGDTVAHGISDIPAGLAHVRHAFASRGQGVACDIVHCYAVVLPSMLQDACTPLKLTGIADAQEVVKARENTASLLRGAREFLVAVRGSGQVSLTARPPRPTPAMSPGTCYPY